MIGGESHIQRLQSVERAREKAGAHQQHKTQSDLHAHSNAPETQRSSAADHLLLERGREIGPPELHCWRQAENETCRQGQSEVEKEDSQINMRRERQLH